MVFRKHSNKNKQTNKLLPSNSYSKLQNISVVLATKSINMAGVITYNSTTRVATWHIEMSSQTNTTIRLQKHEK